MNTTHSRRRVLLGLGAACTAAAAPELGQAGLAENPTLVALGDALPTKMLAYNAAADNVAWIIADWRHKWPQPDPAIIRYGAGTKRHEGIDGRGIEMPFPFGESKHVHNLGTPETFLADALNYEAEAQRKAATRSKRGLKSAQRMVERNRAAIAPARAYWEEVDRIKAASGIEAAQATKGDAMEALREHIIATMDEPENTIAGVVIKAQALTAWAQVDYSARIFNPKGQEWALGLAQAIMRQAGSA